MKKATLFLTLAAGFTLAAATRTATPEDLQKVLDATQPGDTVILQPGVYFGAFALRQAGTAERPITIKADRVERSRVILSRADRAIREKKVRWTQEDAALNLYSIPFSHNPVRVLYSGTDLMPYSSLEGLKDFTLLQGCPGPEHGFFYVAAEKKLYVRLHASKYGPTDPNLHTMCVSPVTAPGFNGHLVSKIEHANLTVVPQGEGHIVIDGITFETPASAGVLSNASLITVRNAWFDGCRFGVFGGGPNDKLPTEITIENTFYHHYPAFDDDVDIINKYKNTPVYQKYSIFWWHRKGDRYCDRDLMKNYETGIAGGIGRGWIIRRNLFSNVFEGLSTWGNSWSRDLEVYENLFENIVDNALEAENHAAGMTIRNNVFRNVFEAISWQPLDGEPWPGPVYVYNNIFYTTPEIQALWPWRPSAFKIGASARNWTKKHMEGVSKEFIVSPGEGFLAFNNTVYHPHGNVFNNPGLIDCELRNFKFFNNIIIAAAFHKSTTYTATTMEFAANLVVCPNGAAQARRLAGEGGKAYASVADLKLKDPEKFDFTPLPGSPALQKGANTLYPKASPVIGSPAWTLPPVGPITEK